jgi:hypothetical protein
MPPDEVEDLMRLRNEALLYYFKGAFGLLYRGSVLAGRKAEGEVRAWLALYDAPGRGQEVIFRDDVDQSPMVDIGPQRTLASAILRGAIDPDRVKEQYRKGVLPPTVDDETLWRVAQSVPNALNLPVAFATVWAGADRRPQELTFWHPFMTPADRLFDVYTGVLRRNYQL